MLLDLDEFLFDVLVCAFSILISDNVFGFILACYSSKSFPSCRCFSILIDDDDSWVFYWLIVAQSPFFYFDLLVDASWSWSAMMIFEFLLAGYSSKSWEGIYKHVKSVHFNFIYEVCSKTLCIGLVIDTWVLLFLNSCNWFIDAKRCMY